MLSYNLLEIVQRRTAIIFDCFFLSCWSERSNFLFSLCPHDKAFKHSGPCDVVGILIDCFIFGLQKLTKGSDSWSLGELVHALVILSHYHAISSFVFGVGIGDGEEEPPCCSHKTGQSTPTVGSPTSRNGRGSFLDTSQVETTVSSVPLAGIILSLFLSYDLSLPLSPVVNLHFSLSSRIFQSWIEVTFWSRIARIA